MALFERVEFPDAGAGSESVKGLCEKITCKEAACEEAVDRQQMERRYAEE